MNIEIPIWLYVYGSPSGAGKIRTVPEDFIVHENLAFEPSGEGEHVFLQIQKTGENTENVARQIARFANVRQRDIGYAGLKDRHAVTTQWFSVWLPGKSEPDWMAFATDNIKVLQTVRHARKLKRGVLSGNRFEITIRDWQGDQAKTIGQLELIKTNGIANYYGEQRFGNQGQNVNKALAMFRGDKVNENSAACIYPPSRSYLFNQILSERVTAGSWNKALSGDTLCSTVRIALLNRSCRMRKFCADLKPKPSIQQAYYGARAKLMCLEMHSLLNNVLSMPMTSWLRVW